MEDYTERLRSAEEVHVFRRDLDELNERLLGQTRMIEAANGVDPAPLDADLIALEKLLSRHTNFLQDISASQKLFMVSSLRPSPH